MWAITKYSKAGDDTLLERFPFSAALSELQIAFVQPADDPMVDSFPVTESQRSFVEERLGFRLEGDTYDYFLESFGGV